MRVEARSGRQIALRPLCHTSDSYIVELFRSYVASTHCALDVLNESIAVRSKIVGSVCEGSRRRKVSQWVIPCMIYVEHVEDVGRD